MFIKKVNVVISCCCFAEDSTYLFIRACRTCSTIIFPHPTNQIVDLWCCCSLPCRHFLNSLLFCRGRHEIVLKCVPHVQHTYISLFQEWNSYCNSCVVVGVYVVAVACVASVSVLFRSKERARKEILGFGRARNETRGKKWMKLTRAIFRAAFAPKQHRNACFAGYRRCYSTSALLSSKSFMQSLSINGMMHTQALKHHAIG